MKSHHGYNFIVGITAESLGESWANNEPYIYVLSLIGLNMLSLALHLVRRLVETRTLCGHIGTGGLEWLMVYFSFGLYRCIIQIGLEQWMAFRSTRSGISTM